MKAKGFKTVAFNVVMAIVAALTILVPEQAAELPTGEVVTETIDLVEAGVVALWTVGNIILRAITNSPIFKG